MKAKRRLKNFDFSGNNAAIALVSVDEAGAANGYQTLVMKGTDVLVELSMAEFLQRFFNIWDGDAAFLARVLGYSDDIDYDLEGKVMVLNEVKEILVTEDKPLKLVEEEPSGNPMPYHPDDNLDYPHWMADLSEYTSKELKEIVKSLSNASGIIITDLENASGDVPASEEAEDINKSSETSPINNEVNMTTETVETIEKSVMDAELAKAVEIAKAEKEAEMQEIMKGLQDQLEVFKAEKIEAEKAKYVEKAKAYESLGVEAEEMAVALMKMASQEELKVVEKALETALKVAKAAEEGMESVGHNLEVDAEESGVQAVLKAQGKMK